MAQLGITGNATDFSFESDFRPMPVGEYKLIVTETDVKPNKKGTGLTMSATFEVIEGEYKGRKIWQYFTVTNSASEVAMKIGQAQISAMYLACGQSSMSADTQTIHNKPFLGKVVIEPGQNGYKDKNKIDEFHSLTVSPQQQNLVEEKPTTQEKPSWM